MSMRVDSLAKRTICTIIHFSDEKPPCSSNELVFPSHIPFSPIDEISLSNSLSSVSPLPHLDRRAIGNTAVAAVTCRTIGLLLAVLPVLLEVLPSRYLALARSSIVDWMWVEERNKVRKHTTCHPVIDSAVVLDVSPSSCCSTPRSSESICRGDFRTIE